MEDQRLGQILWRGKWLIAASLLVSIGLAIGATKLADKVYEATAVLQVTSSAPTGANPNPADVQLASQGLARTYARLITDRGILQQIRGRVGRDDLTVGALKRRIRATAVEDTALVEVRVEGASPEEARDLAEDVARAFVATVQRNSTARVARLQQALEAQIAKFTDEIQQLQAGRESPGVAERIAALRGARDNLIQQQQQLFASGLAQGGSLELTAPPNAQATPISPRPVLNVIAGVLLGLLVGVGLAWLRRTLDRGLHSSEEAEELLNVPVLAAVPVRRRFSSDDPVLGEAYDVLRANLAFLSLDQTMQVLTFTSYNPREGKTSTVEGLAYAAVRGGMNVVMIDGDVRTRTLSTTLGHGDEPGLTSAIVGMASLGDVVVELSPGLSFLPAGPIPPNPPSLLSSGRTRELVAQLREQYELVLVDSPPVEHLADASILGAVSDGIIVVARVGVTDRADLPGVVGNLRHSPAPIVGVVLLEPRTVDRTYYPAVTKGRAPVGDTAVPS
jgi:tyrosine-protein kinase